MKCNVVNLCTRDITLYVLIYKRVDFAIELLLNSNNEVFFYFNNLAYVIFIFLIKKNVYR